MKKILSSLLIGAFVFGVGAANIQPVSAASLDNFKNTRQKYDKSKEKFDSTNRPKPPKDSSGNSTDQFYKNSDR